MSFVVGSSSFGKDYADIYDLIYHDKNYEKECDFIEEIFRKFGVRVSSILDLGCGSGGHAIPLSKREYKVTGVDLSRHMIENAVRKAERANVKCEFLHDDIRSFRAGVLFDAVISMFAVMSYQIEDEDVVSSFKTAYVHLRDGGVFIFDFWFGPAVLREKPAVRFKEVKSGAVKIIRITNPSTDIFSNIVDVNFKILVLDDSKGVLNVFEELHRVRYFFPREIRTMLKSVGFREVSFFPFLDLTRFPDERDWSVSCVALK